MKRFVLTSIFCLGMASTALAAPPTPREKAGRVSWTFRGAGQRRRLIDVRPGHLHSDLRRTDADLRPGHEP